jgi:hypothetical protein
MTVGANGTIRFVRIEWLMEVLRNKGKCAVEEFMISE